MAVTKFLSRKTRLDTIIKYIMNGEKTELLFNKCKIQRKDLIKKVELYHIT